MYTLTLASHVVPGMDMCGHVQEKTHHAPFWWLQDSLSFTVKDQSQEQGKFRIPCTTGSRVGWAAHTLPVPSGGHWGPEGSHVLSAVRTAQ